MQYVDPDDLPHRVRVDHAWIPMGDGVRLHARIWIPADADEGNPVPALLEYLPYRKGDWTEGRDHERHPWYVGHGYASLRVDIRGTGDSEGVFTDEYSESELRDGEAVLDWIAEQPWSTGRAGVFGISWGGFNALQLAARRPKALKAIITVCSTDDRYDNDVHYVGGSVLGMDMTAWAGAMFAFNSRPPDPLRVGGAWRSMWQQRLEGLEPPVIEWLSHQVRDDYWRHGSVGEDYSDIQIPVLTVGGWADPYHDTVLRTPWPAPEVATRRHAFDHASVPVAGGWATIRTPQHLGADSGRFFPFGTRRTCHPTSAATTAGASSSTASRSRTTSRCSGSRGPTCISTRTSRAAR